MHKLTSRQFIAAPLNEVFSFFGEPENLARITPGWLGFQILTPPPVKMREGALIDYLISLGPFPTRWRTLITAYEPPNYFVDEQIAGPYSFWHHTHRFEAKGNGTVISDEIRYLLPFGPLGKILHAVAVKRTLQVIFAHRRRIITDYFEGAAHLTLL